MDRAASEHFLVGTLLALCLACSAPAVTMDAPPPDAAVITIDAVCPLPTGTSYIVSTFALAGAEVGMDLDGDGDLDNMIGNMPAGIRQSANEALQGMIEEGVILLLHFVGWDFPSPTDLDFTLYILVGEDVDEPIDPSNNLGGEGVFWIPDRQFDLDCNLLDASDEASLVDGVCTANTATWDFPILVADGGKVIFLDNHLECVFDDSFTTASCMIAGTLPICSLSSFPFPGDIEGSFLDAIINDASLSTTLGVDMDRDGDGMEQVIGDGVTVLKCIDGNGDVIQSRDCPCHPSIADGYSYTLEFDLVPATVVGSRGT